MTTFEQPVRWDHPSLTRVPYAAYTDADLYAAEQRRLFHGPVWSYLCLDAELAEPGRYRSTFVGEVRARLEVLGGCGTGWVSLVRREGTFFSML